MHQIQTTVQSVWTIRNRPPFYCLPERVRNAAFEAIEKLNATPELAMFCALAAMTAASQANVDVQRPGGGTMPTSLSLIFSDTSATGKSLAVRHFLGVLSELDAEYEPSHAIAQEEYQINIKIWNKKHRKIVGDLFTAREANSKMRIARLESLLEASRAKRPSQPRTPKFTTNDPSVAGLLRAQQRWPWISVFSQEGKTVLDSDLFQHQGHVNLLLDGDSLSRDRAHVQHLTADSRTSFFLVVHPLMLKKFVKSLGPEAIDNGFLPRADFFCPDPDMSKVGYREIDSVAPDLPSLALLRERLRECLLLGLEEKKAGTFRRKTLRLHQEAAEIWRRYAQDEIETNLRRGARFRGIPATASKSIEKVLRIAASIHEFSGNAEHEISVAEIEAAIAIARWCLSEWLRLLGPREEEPEEFQYAREVLETLQAHLRWGRPDLVQQAFILPRVRGKARRQPFFDMGLDVLVANNIVRREFALGSTNRSTKWIRLNRILILPNAW